MGTARSARKLQRVASMRTVACSKPSQARVIGKYAL
jgi:hypothetical protein